MNTYSFINLHLQEITSATQQILFFIHLFAFAIVMIVSGNTRFKKIRCR